MDDVQPITLSQLPTTEGIQVTRKDCVEEPYSVTVTGNKHNL